MPFSEEKGKREEEEDEKDEKDTEEDESDDFACIQLDGADTLSDTDNSDQEATNVNQIPVITHVTRAPRPARDAPTTLTRITRNERINVSETLPTVATANVRSLQPKLNSVIEKVENENISICFLVEIWEKVGKKNNHFEAKITEMMEMKGLKYISTGARPSGVRGGGAAILVNMKGYTLEKLDINVPHNLEVNCETQANIAKYQV